MFDSKGQIVMDYVYVTNIEGGVGISFRFLSEKDGNKVKVTGIYPNKQLIYQQYQFMDPTTAITENTNAIDFFIGNPDHWKNKYCAAMNQMNTKQYM